MNAKLPFPQELREQTLAPVRDYICALEAHVVALEAAVQWLEATVQQLMERRQQDSECV